MNERDIRSVETVQNCWSARFCQPPLPEPTGINADFQYRVREKVLSCVSIGGYDEGSPSYMHALNGPILESEVKAAISLLSNIFKLFERVLDTRIPAVVRIIEEPIET